MGTAAPTGAVRAVGWHCSHSCTGILSLSWTRSDSRGFTNPREVLGTVPGISKCLWSLLLAARPSGFVKPPGPSRQPPEARCASWGPTREQLPGKLQPTEQWRWAGRWELRAVTQPGSWVRRTWVQGGLRRSAAGVLLSLLTAALLSPRDLAGTQAPPGLDREEPRVSMHADPHTVGGEWGSSGKAGRRERLMNHHSMVITC